MDKKKTKKKTKSKENSKEKTKEKPASKKVTTKSKTKKVTKIEVKKKSGEKKKVKSKSKSKDQKNKKGKSKKKSKKGKKTKENDTIMITQKLDGNMFVKKKSEKKEKEEKKTFAEIKIGTPHYDMIPYIKKSLKEKEELIKQLYNEKQNMLENLRNIYNKLDGKESLLENTPEQKDKLTMLYLVLNLNKKNHETSTNIKNQCKNKYIEFLIKNRYNPIEKLNEYGKKIYISKNENFEMTKEIEKLKSINITSKFHIQSISKKEKNFFGINYLINELNTLNNQKQETMIRFKNSKKEIKTIIIKLENLIKIYNENKTNEQNTDEKIIKVEKEINLLKNDLLVKNENELYDKIFNNKISIFNNTHIVKLKISRNNQISSEPIFSDKKTKNIKKNKSIEIFKVNSNYFNEYKEKINDDKDNNNNRMKKILFKKNMLPKIKKNYEKNNKSTIIEQQPNDSIQLNKSINSDELNESTINEINIHEINFKKEYYKIIDKRLENSIKDMENMYKRKIKYVENILNTNQMKYLDLKKRNELLQNEIDNLHKIIHIQLKQFIEHTEKSNSFYEFSKNNINNKENS